MKFDVGSAGSLARGGKRLSEGCKFLRDLTVNVALERHDESGQLGKRDPFPGLELDLVGIGRVDVDVVVAPQETDREPFLLLAPVLAAPGLADQVVGEVVAQPA